MTNLRGGEVNKKLRLAVPSLTSPVGRGRKAPQIPGAANRGFRFQGWCSMAKDSSGNRLPWLKVWVRDLMSEPALQGLSWDQRGRYLWALFCSWDSDHPGEAEDDKWGGWMGHNGDWPEARWAYRPLFTALSGGDGEPELWRQKRLMAEFDDAKTDADKRRMASMKANAVRWDSERTPTGIPNSISSSSSNRKKKTTPTPLATGVAEMVISSSDEKTWTDLFDWFWSEYPRKIAKPAARKAWAGVRPQNQSSIDAISEGLTRWEGVWAGKTKDFIPYPATFLNQRRWEDTP